MHTCNPWIGYLHLDHYHLFLRTTDSQHGTDTMGGLLLGNTHSLDLFFWYLLSSIRAAFELELFVSKCIGALGRLDEFTIGTSMPFMEGGLSFCTFPIP